MDIDTRKARVKSLKRILNCLVIEIKEIKTRGLGDTEELDKAQESISRFCEKIWPFSIVSSRTSHHHHHALHGSHHRHPPRSAASA